jgi:hypothetical protein
MCNIYIQLPVTINELKDLEMIALDEFQSFFKRNPHLNSFYRDRFVAAALCQGAALQFVGKGYGVKDFDIHFFFLQNPDKPRLSRTVYRIKHSVGAFNEMPIDFIRTLIPINLQRSNADETIQEFLRKKPTANANHLANKAVVGLIPKSLFAQIIWQ